jgi:protein-histidine pros-kinase
MQLEPGFLESEYRKALASRVSPPCGKPMGAKVHHTTVDAAPKTLVERYGPANGFGWKMDEIIGAQIVSVPMTVPIERANKTFTAFMGSLAAVFIAIFVLLNVMLYTMVIRRVTNLAGIADQVSLGQFDAGEFRTTSRDEIGVLTEAMGRMKASLVQAMKMLES